ncbi:MAG: hypothetical protein IRZ09_00020 [Variibacter sp.]|nr:hypothetical protein [Variibacter sp.]
MDDASREPPGAGTDAGTKRRRPQQPILDLKAIEVTDAPAEGETPAGPPASLPDPSPASGREEAAPASAEVSGGSFADPGSGERAAAGEPFAQKAAASSDEAAAESGAAAAPPGATAPPPPPSRPRAIEAAAAGAAIGVIAAFGIGWSLGIVKTGEDDALPRIASLEAQLRALAARPADAPEALQALAARAAAGEQALESVKDLQARVARLETALQSRPADAAAQPGASAGTPEALREEVAALRRRVDEIAAAAAAARDAAARAAGSSSAASAGAAGEIDNLGRRVGSLEAVARTLQERLAADSTRDRDRAARFAAAALALRLAVERGEPYAAELAAMEALVENPERLKPLEEAATEGIVGAGALARELSRLIVGLRPPADAGPETGGLLDRLQASASKLVRIRPAGEETSPAAEDALAALEAKAARADIAGALAEAEKLPDALRAPLEPWMQKARTRIAALETARALTREGIAALGANAAAPGRP